MNLAKKSAGQCTLLGNANKFYAGNIKILIDLFDKMILPITYNCEAQGASFFSPKSSRSNFLPEKQCKNPIDKLQGSYVCYNMFVIHVKNLTATLSLFSLFPTKFKEPSLTF